MKIFIKVKAGSKKEEVKKIDATHFDISVKAPPKGGKANLAVIDVLSEFLSVARSRMSIVSGQKSKNKIVEIV